VTRKRVVRRLANCNLTPPPSLHAYDHDTEAYSSSLCGGLRARSTPYSYKEWSMPTKYESFSDESEGGNVVQIDKAEHVLRLREAPTPLGGATKA
jgi:hypothetical protein